MSLYHNIGTGEKIYNKSLKIKYKGMLTIDTQVNSIMKYIILSDCQCISLILLEFI